MMLSNDVNINGITIAIYSTFSVNVQQIVDRIPLSEKAPLLEASRSGVKIALVPFEKGTKAMGTFNVFEGEPVIVLAFFPLGFGDGFIMPSIITHEITHWKQWRRGDFVFEGDKVEWKGVKRNLLPVEVIIKDKKKKKEYFNYPWEWEAYQAQACFLNNKMPWVPKWIWEWLLRR